MTHSDPTRISDDQHNNAPAVPQGWKLVPVEPTRAMWAAVNKLDDEMAAGSYDGKGCSIEQAWNCMLDFAPDAPALAATPAPAPAVPESAKFIANAQALLDLDAEGALTPHGIGGHARNLLQTAIKLLAATPAPAPAQEVATLSLSAEDVHAAFTKNFPKTRISQAWINFAADIAQAIAARAAKPAQEVGLTASQFDLICQAIDKADTATMDGDYMLDSDDCIGVVRVMQVLFDIAALRAKGAV